MILTKLLTVFAQAACDPNQGAGSFFGIPHWYQYLPGEVDAVTGKCVPTIKGLADMWAIGLAVVDMLLYVAGLVAIAYVIYGSFRYMTSQGEADKTAEAKNTVLNALIGLVIVLISIALVSFIGSNFI